MENKKTCIEMNIEFLEPIRVMDWFDHDRRTRKNNKFMRSLSYARWHRSNNGWQLSITGANIRSRILYTAEQLLALTDGRAHNRHCCNGMFNTPVNNGQFKTLRKRPTIKWNGAEPCTEDEPCPFCALLGIGRWRKGKIDKHEQLIHFDMLTLPGDRIVPQREDIACKRIINRIDNYDNKARDFIKIWEIDNKKCNIFEGKIILSDKAASDENIIKFLEDCLRFLDRLCGSLCKIHINEKISSNFIGSGASVDNNDNAAEKIIDLLSRENKTDKLRILANAVHRLRKSRTAVYSLPAGHGPENEHYLWDTGIKNGSSIRDLLINCADACKGRDEISWRLLCDQISRGLFIEAKEHQGGLTLSRRILGEDEVFKNNKISGKPVSLTLKDSIETIVTGNLAAETPFYFGIEKDSTSEHEDMGILLDHDKNFRIPRSALRGIIRRDLGLALNGAECNKDLGGDICPCEVCRIMRKLTVMDSRADLTAIIPPETRDRIRKNPYTGTVADGALFSMEVGPQEMEFPFVLRYRGSKEIPEPLQRILNWWAAGQAFLGGAGSTGKSRFKLYSGNKADGIAYMKRKIDLSTAEERKEYLANLGWRGNEDECIKHGSPVYAVYSPETLPYRELEITIELDSPFINGDPVRALIDHEKTGEGKSRVEGTDLVSFIKYRYNRPEPVYAYKSESFKGVVRAALGRAHYCSDKLKGVKKPLLTASHQDCDCIQCRLLGSVHEMGSLRFEDLEIVEGVESKVFDHVAIDRFQGGAADKKKFDECALIPDESNRIVMKGIIWMKNGTGPDDIKYLGKALSDIKSGLYPLGGKAGIGYGHVSDIIVTGPDEIQKAIQNEFSDVTQEERDFPAREEYHAEDRTDKKTRYPYYLLRPAESVNREPVPVGHENFKPGKHTGKIKCTLNTLTPLIVPDTSNDDYYGLAEKYEGHKSYAFFSISNKTMIPGAPLRAMCSTVYEALTNSCFRVFDEEEKLSWRMPAESAKKYYPGRISPDEKHIQPFNKIPARIAFYKKDEEGAERFEDEVLEGRRPVTLWVKEMKCKLYLGPLKKNDRRVNGIIREIDDKRSKIKILFSIKIRKVLEERNVWIKINKPGNYQVGDSLSCCAHLSMYCKATDKIPVNDTDPDGWKKKTGFLHVTGPCKVEKDPNDAPAFDSLYEVPETWKSIRVNNSRRNERNNLEGVFFGKSDGTIYGMAKTYENFFYDLSNSQLYSIKASAFEKFEKLYEKYNKNPQMIELPLFQSAIIKGSQIDRYSKKLKSGDLVYYKLGEDNKVNEIIPVRISRHMGNKYLGKQLDEKLRPCHRAWLEEDDISQIENYPEKKLFYRHKDGLCPACRLFGTEGYKGRVNFSFAGIVGVPKWWTPQNNEKVTLPLLERPRPTWAVKSEGDKVPGRKFYIHHNAWESIGEKKETPNKNNRTVQVLDRGNTFEFEILFNNLEGYELGLLIYSLRLEKNLAHKAGMAKAFGFGSVEIDVENVLLHSPEVSINDKKSVQWKNANNQVPGWMNEGRGKLEEWFYKEEKTAYSKHINTLKELLFFQESNCPPVKYPELNDYKILKKSKEEDLKNLLTAPWGDWDKLMSKER